LQRRPQASRGKQSVWTADLPRGNACGRSFPPGCDMTNNAASTVLARCIEHDLRLDPDLDPKQLLLRGCRSAQGLCVALYAAAAVFDERSAMPAAFASCGLPGILSAHDFLHERGVLAELLGDGLVQRIDVPLGDVARLGLPQAHPGVGSFLGVPLACRGRRPCGWLYVAEKRDARAFSESDEQVVLTIAAQLVTLLR